MLLDMFLISTIKAEQSIIKSQIFFFIKLTIQLGSWKTNYQLEKMVYQFDKLGLPSESYHVVINVTE